MSETTEDRLRQHYGRFGQDHDRLRDELLARIADPTSEAVGPKSVRLPRWMMRTAAGLAACLVLGALFWLSLSPAISLAEVRAAIERQAWIHVRFDDGEERWASLKDPHYIARKAPGEWIVFLDYATNVIKRATASYISESELYSPDELAAKERLNGLPKTPLEYVGINTDSVLDGASSDERKQQASYVERHADTVDGRNLVRFDFYQRDALDREFLLQQIWVDPATRLPVRIRFRLQLAYREKQGREYIVGEYEYPESGPTDIYALGVSRDLPVVRVDQPLPKDVEEIMQAAAMARQAFPDRFRAIVWPVDNPSSEVDVIWWDGEPFQGNGIKRDDRGVKIRTERYFILDLEEDERNRPYYLPLPATADKVLAWTKTQVPMTINISDGKLTYSKSGPYPAPFEDEPPTSVRVLDIRNIVPFNSSHWPNFYQWPTVSLEGPFALVTAAADAEPGIVMIRREAGRRRMDYYIDPAHDYICTKWIWWESLADQWHRTRDYTLLDLAQLDGGQWYARKRVLKTYPDPVRKLSGGESTWNIDVVALEPDQFPPDCFDGQKMLEEAEASGAVIETY